jgi:hypothetical protein
MLGTMGRGTTGIIVISDELSDEERGLRVWIKDHAALLHRSLTSSEIFDEYNRQSAAGSLQSGYFTRTSKHGVGNR